MPTSDIFTGLNDTDILAMQQDTQKRLNNFFGDQPKQFTNPNDIEQPHAPMGQYGTVSPGQNINLDKTSYDYNAADYNQQIKKLSTQYPDSFKQLPDILLPQSETRRYTNQNFGFDVTRDNEDFYNQHQNAAWEFFGKSIFARLPLLTLSKLGTGTGYLLGLANPSNWFEKNTISAAGDNMFAKFFEGMEDKVKNQWLPVYQSAAARDMGFFERAIKDQTFWSGDITDAAAFMASAFIPGAIASKLSLGAKLASGLGMGDAIGSAGEYLANTAGKVAKYTDIGFTTALNTASESMFEAKQVRDDVYNKLMATGKYTDQEAQNIAGDRARNSFLSNLAALSLSNLWESNLIFKALGKGSPEGSVKLTGSSLLEDYKIPKTSKLGFYGKKALTGIGVEGFYEENIQQAIQQYNENGKNKGDNPLSYTGGVLAQMWNQTINALQGKDKDTAMNIGVGALIGGLFGTSMEAIGKEYSKDQAHIKSALDALNQSRNNWLKIQDIYSVDENGKLKTDYQKAAAILLTQSANTDSMKAVQSIQDPATRNVLQKQLFASLVQSHINNGSFDKLVNQLDDMKNWKSEDLVRLGFDPDSKEGVNSQIEEYKSYANNIKSLSKIIDKLKLSNNDPSVNYFRKNELFSLGATTQALIDEHNKLRNDINSISNKIGNNNVTDSFVHEANVAKLRIESQKAAVENSSELNKSIATKKLEEYEKEYTKLIKDNEDAVKELNQDKDGYFYYKDEDKNKHPLSPELHDLTIKDAQLSNAIEDTRDEYNRHLKDNSFSKEKFDKQAEAFAEQLKNIQKQEEQTQKEEKKEEEKQQEAKPTEVTKKESELTEKQKITKALLDKRNEDLKNAKTTEERQKISQKYLDDVQALNQPEQTQSKSPELQDQRFDELSKIVNDHGKNIKIDDFNKLSKLINDESRVGNIDGLHEMELLNQLNAKNITGTIFDTVEKDIEDENSDKIEDDTDPIEEYYATHVPVEDELKEEDIENETEKTPDENPEVGDVSKDFNPDTNEIEDENLEGDSISYIAYQSSNKTVTQEEQEGENGRYNGKLDEDPYKQFKQGYLRRLTRDGIPAEGIHGKIIKDNADLPHSEETKAYLEVGNPYGSVIVITDMDRNTLYFSSLYESSAEPKEGWKPLVYSFNNIAWKHGEALRAIIGENRTGKSYDDFIAQYEIEQQQQDLVRQLTDQGKEVYIDIKAVTPGVITKTREPLKASEVIPSNGTTSSRLFIPPSPLDRFDPENPLKNKYVLVGNKALLNGGLYAQVIDSHENITSYIRLIPNRIIDIPEIYNDVTKLLNNEYNDENTANLVKDYLKELLFLGTPKRPTIIVSNLENGNFVLKIVQNNITLDPQVTQTFIESQRLNVVRNNIETDNFSRLVLLDNNKIGYTQDESYKKFLFENSTTRDIPIITSEGSRYIGLNSYAIFDFLDSPEAMRKNLTRKEGSSTGERIMKFNENEIPVFRHAKNPEDRQSLNSGKNDISLDEQGIQEAKTLGEKLKKFGIKRIISSPIQRAWQTAREIANTLSIAKGPSEYTKSELDTNKLLTTWDIGKFTSKPDSSFNEEYFVTNPNAIEQYGIKLGESFNTFLNRALKAYKEFSTNPDLKNAAIITHSRVIRVWDAYKENGEVAFKGDSKELDERFIERYLNLPGNFAFTSLNRKEVKQDNSTLTKNPLRRIENKGKEGYESLEAKIDTRENRGLLQQSEIDKVNKTFGQEVAKRVNDIINSDARATWTTAGISLYRDAREGDAYHEQWHHFSQLFLTEREKRSLYDEARKKGLNFTDRDGNKLNTKTASDFQLEEFIADDFRDYSESDGKSRLLDRPYRNNIFRKILDFLKKFFFGDINVSKLYDDLYKGNLSHYEPSINNAMWGKLNSKALNQKGEEIVNNQKAAYYRGVVDYFLGAELVSAKRSIADFRTNKVLQQKVYKNIYEEIAGNYYNPLIDKEERGEEINGELADDLYNILTNWEDFVQYHKQASKLFTSIPGEITLDIPKNEEDRTDTTSEGQDNNELGEFDQEMNDESPEEYEAIYSDKVYDRAGNEQSSLEGASIETKSLIRMLPEVDFKNGNFTIATDANGFPKLCDYAKTWNNLALQLSNMSSYEEMYNSLSDPEVQAKIPETTILIQHLPAPNKEHTEGDIKAITAFRTDFNRAYIGIYSGKIVPQENGTNLYYFNEETKRNRDQVSKLWTNNFVGKLTTDPDVVSENLLTDPETGKYYLNPNKVLTYNMASPVGREGFLKLIGFTFSDQTKKQPFYNNELSQYLKNIQDNINLRHQYGQRIFNPLFDLRSDMYGNGVLLAPGLRGTFNGLLFLEAKYSTETPSLSYQTSEGQMIYGLSLNHTLSIISNKINRAKSYIDLISDPSMQHLDFTNNPNVRGSIFLEYLFNANSGKKLNNNIIVGNYNGLKGEDKNGNTVGYSTTNLNVRQKAIFDINSLLRNGAVEIMRTESSNSAYFIKLERYRGADKLDASRAYLPVGISEFTTSFNSPTFKGILIDRYLRDELYRMKTADDVEIYKKDAKLLKEAKGFNLFRDILRLDSKNTEELKNRLKSDIENLSPEEVIQKNKNAIDNAIEAYFTRELNSFKRLLGEENITNADLGTNIPGNSFDQKIRSFIANDFILNVEYTKLFNGDTIYQAHYKDYFKRSKGDISTGKTPMTDELFARHMQKSENNTFAGFMGSLIQNNYKTTRTVNFVDDERASKYLEIYKKDLKSINPSLSENDLNKFLDKYNKLNIGDGQGWITLDFYRQFLKSINNWNDDQEKMYKVELTKWRLAHAQFNPNYTNEQKELDREFLQKNNSTYSYFPPLKIQYNGPIDANGTYAPVMDKFSVAPLIPSIIQNTPLEDVHNEMIKHGVGYAKFTSGTKKYKAPAYSLYNEDGFTGVDLSKADLSTHFLDYLKEQINTSPKIKEESIFGSQVRKLIEANIFSNGEANEQDLDRHNRYKSYIKGIVDLGRDELYKELSLREEGGKLFINDMKKFISTIQSQADLRDLNDNIKDYIQYDESTKKMMFPLEASLNRRAMQDMIMGIIDRKLRIQKLNGDQLIQISSSGFQSKDFKYRNATEDEVKKYGTNGLKFYHLEYDENGKPVRIAKAQVKVALIGGFEKLLFKDHPDGEKIGTIERLNELLKDDKWRKDNSKKISLIGYRIPTQGHNSIENLEVAEFLPPHAGSVVIVPAEIVAKAGSDFDIDKLSIFRPSLDEYGNLITGNTKEGYSNKIIDLFSEILSDPRTFEKLIRPNDTDLIKGEVNQIAVDIGKRRQGDIDDPQPYSGTQIYRYQSNLRKFETLLSAKKLLAIFAVNNTFTTLMQQAGVTMNNHYQLSNSPVIRNVRMMLLSPKEREKAMKNGRINLGDKYSADGTIKQDYLNQLINATVDAASDDFFGYVNASFENVNVLCHLINQGVPFDRAMRFLNQPALLRYYSDLRKKGVFESKSDIQARILGQLTNQNFYYQTEEGHLKLDYKEFNNAINRVLNTSDAEKFYLSKEVLKRTTVKQNQVDEFLNEPRNKSYNAIVFAYFISLQEQAQLFRNFQTLLNFDTTKISSPISVWQAFQAIEELKKNRMFDQNEFGKMLDKSVIAPFENRKLIATIGYQLMPIAFHPWFTKEIVPFINGQIQFKNRTIQRKVIGNIENQWIEYAIKSMARVEDGPLQRYSKYLTEGKNNVARRFNELISKYPALKTDYSFVNRIRPNFSNKATVKKSNIEIYRLFDNTTDDQNRYISEFRELINLDNPRKYTPTESQEIRKFFTDLAILGFVQSGFSKSNISFQELVPYEVLAQVFKAAIKNIVRYISNDPKLMKDYVKEFIGQFNNLNGQTNIQAWRGRDYYLSDKVAEEIAKKSGKQNIIKHQVQTKAEPAPYENTIKKDTPSIKTVSIPFQPDNIKKILEGKKTTTTRNEAAAKSIGLNPGETGIMNIGGRSFNVHYRGMLNVTEAGGQKAILQSEGVNSVNDFKFQQTKDWFNGKGKLAVYNISPINEVSNLNVDQNELSKALISVIKAFEKSEGEITIGEQFEIGGRFFQVWDGDNKDAEVYGMTGEQFENIEGMTAIKETQTGAKAYLTDNGFLKTTDGKIFFGGVNNSKLQIEQEQKKLLEPEVKTERQYWPGEEVDENESEIKKALGKAEFKLMMDQLSNYEPEFYDIPLNTKRDDIYDEIADSTIITPENFERFWKLYGKFGIVILMDYGSMNDLVKDLKSITNDDFDKIYPNLASALKAYKNDEVSEENLATVEKKLSNYGLMKYRYEDVFNPNQLRLPFDESDEQYNKQINQVLKDKDNC